MKVMISINFLEINQQKVIDHLKKLVEKFRNKEKCFEQKHYPRTAKGLKGIGHDSMRIIKRMAECDRLYGKIISYDSQAYILFCQREKSEG